MNQIEAEKLLRVKFPHIDDQCKLSFDKCFGAMETDIRKALTTNCSPGVALWIIDAIVCHYTGRGTEYKWS